IPLPMAVHDIAGFRLAHRPSIAAYPHRADPRQPQPAMLHPVPRQQSPAITMRGIGPTFKPLARLKPWIARLLTRLHASKEPLESPIDTLARVRGGWRWQWWVR